MRALPVASLIAGLLAASSARADEEPGELGAAARRFWGGGEVVLTPIAGNRTTMMGVTRSRWAPTMVAFGATGRYSISPLVSVGGGVRVTVGVHGFEEEPDANQVDVRVRLGVGVPVAPRAKAYGFAAIGFTTLLDDQTSPSGSLLELGGGASYALQHNLALTGELGYHRALLSGPDALMQPASVRQSYMQLAVGFVVPIR